MLASTGVCAVVTDAVSATTSARRREDTDTDEEEDEDTTHNVVCRSSKSRSMQASMLVVC